MLIRIEAQSHWVMIPEEQRVIRCVLRGKFKHDLRHKKDKLILTDVAAVGDYVNFDMIDANSGVIHSVDDRKNFISRKAPKQKGATTRGERYEQVIAANIDYIFPVCSFGSPVFNNKVLDRFLVIAESSNIQPIIIFNKIDLVEDPVEIEFWYNLYTSIGYKIHSVSAMTGEGIPKLRELFYGHKSLFWGHSGVGKSSLINALFPELKLSTGEVSSYNQKGKHTTVIVSMNQINRDTFLIDTPGIREIAPFGIQKDDLAHYFPDLAVYLQSCKYKPCTHNHEPGCEVVAAVEREDIDLERYDSYLRLLENIEDDLFF